MLWELSEDEAAALAAYVNAIQVQRLAELARILEQQGEDLSVWDGSLQSLDVAWGWAVRVAESGFAGIPAGVQASNALAFGVPFVPSEPAYVSELIDQYTLAVVQKVRPGARWIPRPEPGTTDFQAPQIHTPTGPIWRQMLQSVGLLVDLSKGAFVTDVLRDPRWQRLRVSSDLTEAEIASDSPGPSILTPLLTFSEAAIIPPQIPPYSPDSPGNVPGASDADEDWDAEAFELSGKGKGEPWRVRPMAEKHVLRWLLARAYTQPDGSALTVAFLRSRDQHEQGGTVRDLGHADDSSTATILSARGRLRGLVIEPRTDDRAFRRSLLMDLHLLAKRARGTVEVVGL